MIVTPERMAALTATAQSYAGNVDEAVAYLASRGITREVADMFLLGYVPSGQFAGRLSIPYMTPAGCIHIKYRCTNLAHHQGFKHTDSDCPKYLYESGTSTHLFNAQVLIHTGDTVVITEGELDAICVQAYCGIPAVAYPGVDTWAKQKYYRMCFEGVSEVVVIADGDPQGKEAARRVAESIGLSARVVEMPTGHDSNSYIASNGAGAFLERLQ